MDYHGAAEVIRPVDLLKTKDAKVAVAEIPDIESDIPLSELQRDIKYGKVLLPGTCVYEKAVFIGNLLYRMQKPIAVVQANAIEDVQVCVRFARKYSVQLTVKNGGHSYAGYCLNDGGIVLDLALMNQVQLCAETMTVSLQAGAVWKNAYEKLKGEFEDKMIIGGQCPWVGVSGFTLGGGLSPFSRSYGLGIDNILEMSVVTARGDLVTVSADSTSQEERDLYWALCGGGGGNFGVTVAFKSRLHTLRDPQGRVVCGQLSWNLPEHEADYKKMMKTFNDEFHCPDELTIDAIWRFDKSDNLMGQMTVLFNGNMDDCQKVLAPLLKYNPTSNDLKEMHYSKWAVISEGFDIKSLVYHHHASFIMEEGAITEEVTGKIVELMHEAAEILERHRDPVIVPIPPIDGAQPPPAPPKSSVHILWDQIGGVTTQVPSNATAFPWRSGVYVVNVKVQWTRPDQDFEMYQFVNKCSRYLRPHAIDQKASYLNYIDNTLPNWQEAYYGDNYSRLQDVKTTWDPTGFFRFDQGIQPRPVHTNSVVQPLMARMAATPSMGVPRSWQRYSVREPEKLLSANTFEDVFKTNMEMRKEY